MTPALLLDNLLLYVLQVALVAAAALSLPPLFRLGHPSAAQRWYQGALVLLLLLPLFHIASTTPRGTVSVAFGPAKLEAGATVAGAAAWRPSAAAGVLLLLASGALLHLLRLAVGLAALGRRYRSAHPPAALSSAAEAVLERSGLRPKLLLAEGQCGAQAFGFLRPAILLPEAFADLPGDAQASILAHELAHLRRHDGLAVLLEEAARALLWFHPAVWLVLERAALSREQAADAGAVALTGARRAYARTLVEVAAAQAGHALVPAVPYLTRGHLARWVALLQKEVHMDTRRTALTLTAAGALALCVAVFSAWAFPLVVPAAQAAAPPPPSALKELDEPPAALSRVNPVYPEAAKEKGLSGKVTLELVVDEGGKVADARVVESTDPVFDAPALEAVRQWTFEPPVKGGKPARARFLVNIAFRLQ